MGKGGSCKYFAIRQRIIWRDSNGRARETLGLDQELGSPVDGVELGGGCFRTERSWWRTGRVA